MPYTRYPADPNVDPSPLAKPLPFEFTLVTAKNRLMKAAMSDRLATWSGSDKTKRGVPGPELAELYRLWGQEDEYGVVLTSNIMMDYDQLEAPGCMIVPPGAPTTPGDARFEGFKAVASASTAQGSFLVGQVSHPGRQVTKDVNPNPISPSDVQLQDTMGMSFGKPRPMTAQDIENVKKSFIDTAEYLYKAGFSGIELHGAHGYLLAQFLSKTTNKRTDAYGGDDINNRARFIFEIVDGIRRRLPPAETKFLVGIKVNSVEFQSGGFTPEDCAELCSGLEAHGVDFVELSGGTYEETAFVHKKESTRAREAFFLEFAKMIAPRLSKTKTYITGGLRSVGAMVHAVESCVDGVCLGRPAAHEYDLARKILSGEVKSAVRNCFSDDDFSVSLMAAGVQMRLAAKGKQPLDMSREDHFQVYLGCLQKWAASMADNADGEKVGYADIVGLELHEYGKLYAAAEAAAAAAL